MRLGHHRRFTANHTFHLDAAGRRLFVKVSPHPAEAAAEVVGHVRLRGWYPVPRLLWRRSLGSRTVLVYERHGDGWPDEGLLLDEINTADHTGSYRLDGLLSQIIARYYAVIRATLRPLAQGQTVTKLYGDRARVGGRLDCYYGTKPPILVLPDGETISPADLVRTTLLVNGRAHRIDYAAVLAWLRRVFDSREVVWAALTQGDPTDVNIGAGPVWFDYDTAGMNAVAGEFACFLWYQRLHGGWLVPTYNPAAFADHPRALTRLSSNRPTVRAGRDRRHAVRIDYHHQPSPARRHVIGRYYHELVRPLADHLGVRDVMDWLRPYLVLRILGVHSLTTLTRDDAALSLAYLAETLSPRTTPRQLLAGPPAVTSARHDGRHEPATSRPLADRAAARERPRGQNAPGDLLQHTPVPPDELVDNLALYLARKPLMDLLALDALYRAVLTVPGVIMEFGVRWGRHLAALTALRSLHEPYNVHRRIIGFDTFTGFPTVSDVDRVSRHAKPGGLAVPPGYPQHLEHVTAAHEATDPLAHVRRTFHIVGDVRHALPRYLRDNPHTVIAFAYFDLDLYEPTRDTLTEIKPYLTGGSVLAFDQVGHGKWPGETLALREVLGTDNIALELLPGFPSPAFYRWRPSR